ncbi:MAG TPA: molybdopterin-dependent oxidoreductase, partial [Candidatus Binatus sp.]|nr:molybdopterin-dependent oxidoreductase [Candidatus Binatus sp.]
CSLGSSGLRDDVIGAFHLCMTRLERLSLNTMGALDVARLGNVDRLRKLKPAHLRRLGRLSYPMIRRNGEAGFSRVTWDGALGAVCKAIHDTAPHQMAFVAASRALTNEVYYVFQKLARVLGTNNVDLCARSADAGISALKATLGIGAPTCSFADLIGTELLLIFDTGLAKNQQLILEYLRCAKKAGTRILVVSPMRDGALHHYRPQSVPTSAPFGATLTDEFFQVSGGGYIAFINGVLKSLIAGGRVDMGFVDNHTAGFAELKAVLGQQSWQMLEQRSGVPRGQLKRVADLYGQAKCAVLVYSAALAEQEGGVDTLKAIVNLALARGMLGRHKCGITRLDGDSAGQSASDCGATPETFPGGFAVNHDNARRFSNLWYHPVPSSPGLRVAPMIDAAQRGEIRFLYSMSGDLMKCMADGDRVSAAIKKIPLRVHQDVALNGSMLLDADDTVILLPAQTCYEQRSGGTMTNSERRIRFTPEIPGHRIGESLPAWEIPVLLGQKSMPNGDKLFPFAHSQAIRDEMSRVMPIYQGIDKLDQEGDQLQWGGEFLFKDGFTAMPDNRALLTTLEPLIGASRETL